MSTCAVARTLRRGVSIHPTGVGLHFTRSGNRVSCRTPSASGDGDLSDGSFTARCTDLRFPALVVSRGGVSQSHGDYRWNPDYRNALADRGFSSGSTLALGTGHATP